MGADLPILFNRQGDSVASNELKLLTLNGENSLWLDYILEIFLKFFFYFDLGVSRLKLLLFPCDIVTPK